MLWLFFLLFHCRLFAQSFDDVTPSSSEEILSLTTDLLIDGVVSVTSGQFSLTEDDLTVRGAQDLVLKRIYVPPRILGRYDDKDSVDRLILGKALYQLKTKGWVVHPHLWAGYNSNSKFFQVRDPQGFVLEFDIQGNKGVLQTSPYGCSNLRGETPTSSADIRNIEFVVIGNQVKVTWPDGMQRIYSRKNPRLYCLEKEILSNGKVIRYEYVSQELTKIFSCDPNEKCIYASITRLDNNHYIGSNGTELNLIYEKREIKGKYKKGSLELNTFINFPVMIKSANPIYTNTAAYNERTLLNWYDAQKYPISCTYFQNKNVPVRIQTLSNPSGSFSFSYDPVNPGQKNGSTTVIHPDGVQTVYRFNKILLLEAIENSLNGKIINKKTFEYDFKQHIKRIQTQDGNGNPLLTKHFECDQAGNAIVETTEGDFGIFRIERIFDRNRLVFEEYDDGLQYIFTYLGNTRLLTSKTTLESGAQLRKTVYSYDDCNNLIRIEEVGKTRTVHTLYQKSPHLHLVEWKEKTDWKGKLIHKVHYSYDGWGNTNQEKHFGSDGKLAYTIQRTYNEKGELLKETNPLGEIAIYQYDLRGRCVYEKPFSNGLIIYRAFDNKGRLSLLEEGSQKTQFLYNASDELIKKIDYLGCTTTYHYDLVHGKPNRIEEGPSVTQIYYDSFGRPIETIDAMNAKTTKKYNSYGDVIQITHPEGGKEFFEYNPNGLIKSHKDPDGLMTTYTYDALGRTKKKTVGKWTTIFDYDGYNLYKMIDSAGLVTTYTYDLIDRKIEENRADRSTYYEYDALGFVNRERKGKHQTDYVNDSLGRVLKKSIDGDLETSWRYDAGGNVTMIEQGASQQHFSYDAHNRCIEKIDEIGNKTTISYEKGSQILIQKTVDPLEIETVHTFNSKDQLLTKSVAGKIAVECEYDSLFRLQRQDHLHFHYTPNGNKDSMQEAGIRTTRWTYTPGNLQLTKHKADGTVVAYSYDKQLLPKKIGSREFRYDKLGRLIGGTGFSRVLDPFGNILREEWSNGLWIETDYDELNRPLIRRLSDKTSIRYEYKGALLKKVIRISKEGDELYYHSYDDYDSNGNPHIEKGLFQTTYDYDLKGRKVSQKNPYFVEEIEYDARGNLIRKGNTAYTYDALCQMTSESGKFTAKYDVHHNLAELNDQSIVVDKLNQIKGQNYDLNGNLIRSGFVYDEFDQLIEAEGEKIVYDALGRRIQKGETTFLYIDEEEIGAFENGKPKELKILGRAAPIAIEINQIPYAPIIDVQGVIRALVDWQTKKICKKNECDAFGDGLTEEIPYAYTGKRYDPKTNLVYFGKRYYDSNLRRWLTPDPIGSSNHSNLYQYLFNSPYRYQDINGEFAFALPLLIWGAELAAPAISACITAIVYSATAGAIAYGGYKLVETFNNWDYRNSSSIWKNGSVDPTLPENPDDLLKRPDWKETTHPKAKERGHRTFENKQTGEQYRHDQGRPGAPGHEANDHWHHLRPNEKGDYEYLDGNGNLVPKGSDKAHIYTD